MLKGICDKNRSSAFYVWCPDKIVYPCLEMRTASIDDQRHDITQERRQHDVIVGLYFRCFCLRFLLGKTCLNNIPMQLSAVFVFIQHICQT